MEDDATVNDDSTVNDADSKRTPICTSLRNVNVTCVISKQLAEIQILQINHRFFFSTLCLSKVVFILYMHTNWPWKFPFFDCFCSFACHELFILYTVIINSNLFYHSSIFYNDNNYRLFAALVNDM